MKMSEVFDLPLNSDFDTVSDRNKRDLATFDTCKEDEAAAHAINNHDKLVEALELAEAAINVYAIDLNIPDDTIGRNKIREALKQAKGE